MNKNFIVIFLIAVYLLSIASFNIYIWHDYSSKLSYWGNAMLGVRSYWLHPKNANFTALEPQKYYHGTLRSADLSSGVTLTMDLDVGTDNPKDTTITLPHKIMANNLMLVYRRPDAQMDVPPGVLDKKDLSKVLIPGADLQFLIAQSCINSDCETYLHYLVITII